MGIQFYHWLLLGVGFWLLDFFKIGRITAAMAFAAGVVCIVSYLKPELAWGWQVWGFVMVTALGSISYLRTLGKSADVADNERKLLETKTASRLIGSRVTLSQPLYPGHSKLEVKGRYWKVAANRDFPAGTVVEVVGHEGNTLEIVSAETTHYQVSRTKGEEGLSLNAYHRDPAIEALYGEPDMDNWLLFREALQEHSKEALVNAYHVLSGLHGKHLDEAREELNTCTLALYDRKNEGLYETIQENMYSDPNKYEFLYMNGRWPGLDLVVFEQLINELIAALHTPWADRIRGEIGLEMARRAVMMIRKQQVKATRGD